MELAAISHDCILQSTCVCIVQHPLLAMGGPLHYIQIGFGTPSVFGYCNYSFKYYIFAYVIYRLCFYESNKLMVSDQLFSIVATSKILKFIHC